MKVIKENIGLVRTAKLRQCLGSSHAEQQQMRDAAKKSTDFAHNIYEQARTVLAQSQSAINKNG